MTLATPQVCLRSVLRPLRSRHRAKSKANGDRVKPLTRRRACMPHSGRAPPLRISRLASASYIRARLHHATRARVSPNAIQSALRQIETLFEEIVERARSAYERETLARRVHRTYERGVLRVDHVEPRRVDGVVWLEVKDGNEPSEVA